MNLPPSRLAAAAFLSLALGAGCGGSSDSPPIVKRIAFQEMTSSVGAQMQSWDYAYDDSGRTTQTRGYNSVGAHVSTTTPSYSGDRRTGSTMRTPGGALVFSVEYGYVGGVLDSSTRRDDTGAVSETAAYAFAGGRKLSTSRFTPVGDLIDRREFHYDPGTGVRTGSTVYDPFDAVTGSSAWTYSGGLFTEVEVVSGGVTTYRIFTYEDGPLADDYELFFEY